MSGRMPIATSLKCTAWYLGHRRGVSHQAFADNHKGDLDQMMLEEMILAHCPHNLMGLGPKILVLPLDFSKLRLSKHFRGVRSPMKLDIRLH